MRHMHPLRSLKGLFKRGNSKQHSMSPITNFNFTELPYDIQFKVLMVLSRHDLLNAIKSLEDTQFAVPDGAIKHIKSPNDEWSKGALINIVDIDCEKNEWDYAALVQCLPKATNHIYLHGFKQARLWGSPLDVFLKAHGKLASLEVTVFTFLRLTNSEIHLPLVLNCTNPFSSQITFIKCDASVPVTLRSYNPVTAGYDLNLLKLEDCTSEFNNNMDISGIRCYDICLDIHFSPDLEIRDKIFKCNSLNFRLGRSQSIHDCIFLARNVCIEFPFFYGETPTVRNVDCPIMIAFRLHTDDWMSLDGITDLNAPVLESICLATNDPIYYRAQRIVPSRCLPRKMNYSFLENVCFRVTSLTLKAELYPLCELRFNDLKCLMLEILPPMKASERVTQVFPKLTTLKVVCKNGVTVIPAINAPALTNFEMENHTVILEQGTLQECLDRYPKLEHLKVNYALFDSKRLQCVSLLSELKSVSSRLKWLSMSNVSLSPEIFDQRMVAFPELLYLDIRACGHPCFSWVLIDLDAPKLQRLSVFTSSYDDVRVGYFPDLKEYIQRSGFHFMGGPTLT